MKKLSSNNLALFEKAFHDKGLPLTRQRRDVLSVLAQRDDHPTAEQIYDSIRKNNLSVSRKTIYRVLETLSDLGLINRVHHIGTALRFDGKTQRHHHLLCKKCSRIVDLHSASLDDLPLPKGKYHGFEVHDFSVQILGFCRNCRQSMQRK